MSETIAVINQKGGVGKSTTVHAFGAGLALMEFKVLFIDLDPQGNLSYALGLSGDVTSFEVIVSQVKIDGAIQNYESWDGIAASPELSAADIILTKTGKEYRLKEALEIIRDRYDYIIIDTPPALGILTINALTACTGVIIPAQADIFSLQGIGQVYNTIKAVKQYCNQSLVIKGILLTRFNSRSILSRDVSDMISDTASKLQTIVYETAIRESVSVREAQAKQQDIFSYAPKSNPANDYMAFIKEFLS